MATREIDTKKSILSADYKDFTEFNWWTFLNLRNRRNLWMMEFQWRPEAMQKNVIRLLLGLLAVAITCATPGSERTFAGAQKSSGASELAGTSWQLVKLQDYDNTTHVPDDRSKYTITFGRDGRVTARVDCNRGGSTWKSARAGELQFGSWSMTRAKCPPGSLHDQIVTDGAAVRSYAIKDGHLFLSGMASGGSYELEPVTVQKRQPSKRGRL
jgi:heat shock protein HslJ